MAGNDSQFAPEGSLSGPSPRARSREEHKAHAEHTGARPFDPTELLARLWQQNLPALRARVAALDDAASEAAAGALTPATCAKACDLAHKLAGSLGMFGFPRGTEIAREFEETLEASEQPDAVVLLRLVVELRAILPL